MILLDIPDISCNSKRKLAAVMSVYKKTSYHLISCVENSVNVRQAPWHDINESIFSSQALT